MIIKFIKVKEALGKSGLYDIDYALNPYLGCYHSCIYCYARDFTRYREIAENWGKVIYVKENLIDVLKKEVVRKPKGIVGISTITDPYQPVEMELEITRKSLDLLSRHNFRVSIQTKSHLVLRDQDIITPKKFDVGVTITSLNNDTVKLIEPNSSLPSQRIKVVKVFSERNVETWIFLGPIIPEINDSISEIKDIIILAKETNSLLYYDKLNMKPIMKKYFIKLLSKYGFNLNRILKKIYNNSYWKHLFSNINTLCTRYGAMCKPAYNYSFVKSLSFKEFS